MVGKVNFVLILLATIVSETIKIVGGGEAKPHSIPHQVAIVGENSNILQCGGTILSRGVVLTSAHCFQVNHQVNDRIFYPPNTFQIVAGEHDLKDDEDLATRHNIKAVNVHPKWK